MTVTTDALRGMRDIVSRGEQTRAGLGSRGAWLSRGREPRSRRRFGFERPHFGVVRADDAPGGLGHLVPDAGDVAEGLGDDQPGVV